MTSRRSPRSRWTSHISMSPTIRLAEQLIACRSVTPNDNGCQEIISARLKPLGFAIETIVSGPETFRVTNMWAKRPVALVHSAQPAINLEANSEINRETTTSNVKTLVFVGHTDVVPTGPLDQEEDPDDEPSFTEITLDVTH